MSFFVNFLLITIGYTKVKLRRYVPYLNCICPDKFILIQTDLSILSGILTELLNEVTLCSLPVQYSWFVLGMEEALCYRRREEGCSPW